jgi:hypothetical protein
MLLETVFKVIVVGSWRLVRGWQDGFARVYQVIHASESNAARREPDP